jgi:hypothetical protein
MWRGAWNTAGMTRRAVNVTMPPRAEALAHTRLRVDPDYSVTYANLVLFQLQAGRVTAAESSLAHKGLWVLKKAGAQ